MARSSNCSTAPRNRLDFELLLLHRVELDIEPTVEEPLGEPGEGPPEGRLVQMDRRVPADLPELDRFGVLLLEFGLDRPEALAPGRVRPTVELVAEQVESLPSNRVPVGDDAGAATSENSLRSHVDAVALRTTLADLMLGGIELMTAVAALRPPVDQVDTAVLLEAIRALTADLAVALHEIERLLQVGRFVDAPVHEHQLADPDSPFEVVLAVVDLELLGVGGTVRFRIEDRDLATVVEQLGHLLRPEETADVTNRGDESRNNRDSAAGDIGEDVFPDIERLDRLLELSRPAAFFSLQSGQDLVVGLDLLEVVLDLAFRVIAFGEEDVSDHATTETLFASHTGLHRVSPQALQLSDAHDIHIATRDLTERLRRRQEEVNQADVMSVGRLAVRAEIEGRHPHDQSAERFAIAGEGVREPITGTAEEHDDRVARPEAVVVGRHLVGHLAVSDLLHLDVMRLELRDVLIFDDAAPVLRPLSAGEIELVRFRGEFVFRADVRLEIENADERRTSFARRRSLRTVLDADVASHQVPPVVWDNRELLFVC